MTAVWRNQMALAWTRGLARVPWLRSIVESFGDLMTDARRKWRGVVRDTRVTLMIVSVFYVAVGFVLSIASLVAGEPLGTFLGFLTIGGTLAGSALLRSVIRTDKHVLEMHHALARLHERLDRIEASIAEPEVTARGIPFEIVDFGGASDVAAEVERRCEQITAATLERDVFPRLVTLLEREQADRKSTDGQRDEAADLLERWENARSAGDLIEARRLFSGAASVIDPGTLKAMGDELHALARATELSFRRRVRDCVDRRDVTGLVEVLQEIRAQLPDHPMAKECAQIESFLRLKARGDNDIRDSNLSKAL